jgi:hypothetical protein
MASSTATRGIYRTRLYDLELPAVRVRVEGLTPLLMNNPAGMGKVPSKGTPEEQAEPIAYRDEEGWLVLPSIGLRNSLASGGRHYNAPEGRRKLQGYLMEVLQVLPQPWLALTRDGQPVRDYAIEQGRAVVGGSGVMRCRPRIDPPWEPEAELAWYSPDQSDGFALKMLKALEAAASMAGVLVGLGDFRPERTGVFGRYKVTFL